MKSGGCARLACLSAKFLRKPLTVSRSHREPAALRRVEHREMLSRLGVISLTPRLEVVCQDEMLGRCSCRRDESADLALRRHSGTFAMLGLIRFGGRIGYAA